jgi:hypothetical protein
VLGEWVDAKKDFSEFEDCASVEISLKLTQGSRN